MSGAGKCRRDAKGKAGVSVLAARSASRSSRERSAPLPSRLLPHLPPLSAREALSTIWPTEPKPSLDRFHRRRSTDATVSTSTGGVDETEPVDVARRNVACEDPSAYLFTHRRSIHRRCFFVRIHSINRSTRLHRCIVSQAREDGGRAAALPRQPLLVGTLGTPPAAVERTVVGVRERTSGATHEHQRASKRPPPGVVPRRPPNRSSSRPSGDVHRRDPAATPRGRLERVVAGEDVRRGRQVRPGEWGQ